MPGALKSTIRGAAISINQDTRVDTTTNTTIIIVKVDINTIIIARGAMSLSGVTSRKQRVKPLFLCSLGKVL